jgi:hypothetical protein
MEKFMYSPNMLTGDTEIKSLRSDKSNKCLLGLINRYDVYSTLMKDSMVCFYVNVHLKFTEVISDIAKQIHFIITKKILPQMKRKTAQLIYFVGDFNTDISKVDFIDIPGYKYVLFPSPPMVSSLGGNNKGKLNDQQVDFMLKVEKIG